MYFLKGIPGGIAIGLAGLLNCYLGGGIPGAIAFGLGLLIVCVLKVHLFTGKMRAVHNKELDTIDLLDILFGNFIGIVIIYFISLFLPNYEQIVNSANAIMLSRATASYFAIFIRAVLCGICVQIAVDMCSTYEIHPFYAMLPASAFVLLGCNHCIADMLYMMYGLAAPEQIFQLIFAIGGNITGAMLIVYSNFCSFPPVRFP